MFRSPKNGLKQIQKNEKISKEFLLKNIAKGRIVIIPNRKNEKHVALGDGLKSKIISNIGTSSNQSDPEKIYKMIEIANEYGVDLLCDLSVGGDLSSIRRKLIDKAEMPLASIPLYQTSIEAKRKRNSFHRNRGFRRRRRRIARSFNYARWKS